MLTFTVVGHNETERLGEALRQAHEAAGPDDAVWYVDSASSDGSAEAAAALGARVLHAPAGKGRAVARLLDEVETEYVVMLDADVDRSTRNIAATLRDAVRTSGADLVVAQFEEPRMPVRHSSRYVWRPLVRALFPEAHDRFGRIPFSGFRALRTGIDLGDLPGGFGVETHMNLVVAAAGGSVELADVGTYWGPIRSKPLLPRVIGTTILDLAESYGRIDAEARPLWDEWLERIAATVIERAGRRSGGETPAEHAPDPDYVARLEAAATLGDDLPGVANPD